ncbi:putative zinc finger protein 727 isoform X2 [Takifugu flavidus]|uniref:putative zinc finger protein 727 isoform X2 n=1 Tax=Takifugu flavidus TaxID=433684 RepID=UPI0025446DFA|nr:putative zinc finger protein 727 isoform X2 [Takifugu flavidus]
MPVCCVSSCKGRNSSTDKLKFYRIPSKYRPLQANRRRLWLKAIQEANGVAKLSKNARICGAHFKSGEASMDHTNPDFVPSVFQCIDPNQHTKKNVKRTYGRRKKGHCKAKVNNIKETNSPLDGRVSETQTQSSSSVLQEEETATDGDETELQLQTTSTPNKASETTQESKGLSKLPAMIPILCLKSVFAPRAGYLCELCSQKFSCASELLRHKQHHETPVSCEVSEKVSTEQEGFPKQAPQPSFPCNVCDRSFATSQSLKRHKLLHVKDDRRCPKCGIIFCQLHNHVLFVPLPRNEQDSTTDESLSQDADFNHELSCDELETSEPFTVESEMKPNSFTDAPGRDAEASAARSVVAMKPEPTRETLNPLPPPSHLNIPNEVPLPKLKRLLNPRVSRCFRDDYPADYIQRHLPQSPQLRPHLKVFSPQRLTSALLEVTRNYEYILNEPAKVKSGEQRTAFDLEVVL